jgi:hypothetical protein
VGARCQQSRMASLRWCESVVEKRPVRTVLALRVYDEPPYGREVHIVFTDGTQISIDLEIATRVRTKHYRSDEDGVEMNVLHEHDG